MLLPAQSKVPILAIGPGTGIAPIRSIVQERIARDPSATDNTVVLGCRFSHRDFLLKAEWEKLADKPKLADDDAEIDEQLAVGLQSLALRKPLIRLYIAASRDQPEKVYVQDVLRSQAALVWNILGKQRGIAYLSGSSGRMPEQVREAILEIFQTEGCMDRDQAERYFAALESEKRWQEECW